MGKPGPPRDIDQLGDVVSPGIETPVRRAMAKHLTRHQERVMRVEVSHVCLTWRRPHGRRPSAMCLAGASGVDGGHEAGGLVMAARYHAAMVRTLGGSGVVGGGGSFGAERSLPCVGHRSGEAEEERGSRKTPTCPYLEHQMSDFGLCKTPRSSNTGACAKLPCNLALPSSLLDG